MQSSMNCRRVKCVHGKEKRERERTTVVRASLREVIDNGATTIAKKNKKKKKRGESQTASREEKKKSDMTDESAQFTWLKKRSSQSQWIISKKCPKLYASAIQHCNMFFFASKFFSPSHSEINFHLNVKLSHLAWHGVDAYFFFV